MKFSTLPLTGLPRSHTRYFLLFLGLVAALTGRALGQPTCSYPSPYGVDDDTVALWHFNETSGSTVYDETGLHTGDVQGAPATTQGPFGTARVLGGVGSGSYITVPDPGDLDGFAEVTVEAWIFPTGGSGELDLVAKGQHTGNRPDQARFPYELGTLGLAPSDPPGVRFTFFLGTVTGLHVEVDSSIIHPFNEWLYVAGTYDGHKARIYVNGRLEAESSTVDGVTISNGQPVFINNLQYPVSGGFIQSNGGIPGNFDEIRISKRARSAGEIAAAYAALSGPCAMLVNAGSDATVSVGTPVTLHGSTSAVNCTPEFSWRLIGGPTTALSGANTATPSFTPNVAGVYTAELTVSCGSDSGAAKVHINATSGTSHDLLLNVVNPHVLTGGLLSLTAKPDGGLYTWSFTQKGSGEPSLSPVQGDTGTVYYTAGQTPGQDIVHVVSSISGAQANVTITVLAVPLPEGKLIVTPNPTQNMATAVVNAQFNAAVTKAELCIDPMGSPPTESCWIIPANSDGLTATWSLPTAPSTASGSLSYGSHLLATRGYSDFGWGPLSTPTPLKVTKKVVILLINGYNFLLPGAHPWQWWNFRDAQNRTIPCQIRDDFFGKSDCSPLSPMESCRSNSQADLCSGIVCSPTSPADVCVVDNVNGQGDIDEDVSQVESYVSARPWLQDAGQYILIGHSYGGQVSRMYAARHPEKVTAVITLDTPYFGAGTKAYLKALFSGAIFVETAGILSDNAIWSLTFDGAHSLNTEIMREAAAHKATVPTHAIASEAQVNSIDPRDIDFNPSLTSTSAAAFKGPASASAFRPHPTIQRGIGSDNIVPIDSQIGNGATNVLTQPALEFKPSGYSLYDNLHNRILEKEDPWALLFTERLCHILGLYHSSPPCTAIKNNAIVRLSEATTPIALPAAQPLDFIKQSSGMFDANTSGAELDFDVDQAQDLALDVVTSDANTDIVLISPDHGIIAPTSVDGLTTFFLSSRSATGTHQTLLVREPATGAWKLMLTVPGNGGLHIPATGSTWKATITGRSPLALNASLDGDKYLPGEFAGIHATLDINGVPLTGPSVLANVTSEDGTSVTALPLFDDGMHGDGMAGDGVYGGTFNTGNAGDYTVAVTASGTSPLGSFNREADATFSVGTAGSTIMGPFVESAPDLDGDGRYDSLAWSFTLHVPAAGNYTCLGDLLAADGSLVTQGIATVSATGGGDVPVTLSFPGLEIYRKAKLVPYTLSNLRITVGTPDGERLSGRPTDSVLSGGPYWSWMSFQRDANPNLIWTRPVVEQIVTGNSVGLQWSVFDGNGATTLDLYYDTTGSGFAGTPIVTGLAATQGDMSYTWDMTGLPDGVYFVYARVRNGDFSDAIYGGSLRKLRDSDGDGMPDAWETAHGLNPNSAADTYLDPDGDGLSNFDEYLNGTDPHMADTDGGGESDLSEAVNGRDGTNPGDDVTSVSLTSVSPGEGDSRGGEQVLVLGSGLKPGATVSFGGTPASDVTFVNNTRLLVQTPGHAVGTTDVTVSNPSGGGSATKTAAFMFLCQFVEPPLAANNGPLCPGQTLQLTTTGLNGASFGWTGPNGFSSALQSPTVTNAGVGASGIYTVTETVGQCVVQGSTTVSIGPNSPATPAVSIPNGGEIWYKNHTYNIQWSNSGGGCGTSFKIEVYRGGAFYGTISGSTTSNGSYSWTVPTSYPTGNDYTIKISDATFPGSADLSNSTFSISDPQSPVFADGYESGSTSPWSSRLGDGAIGNLANSIRVPNGGSPEGASLCGAGNPNGARFNQNCGALVSLISGDTTPAYVQDNSPSGEPSYRARFYINLRTIQMQDGDEFEIFTAYDGADPAPPAVSGNAVLRLVARQTGGHKRLSAFARLNSGAETEIPAAILLADGWRSIEIDWAKATALGAHDGRLGLWVDGTSRTGLSGLDNDTLTINYSRLGAVAGLDPGTTGTFHTDDFVSQRSGYIGPAYPFDDVATTNSFFPFIQGIYAAEVIPECAIGSFCSEGPITRKEMAKFLLLARYGPSYTPPACTTPRFNDAPCSSPWSPWINEIAREGITAGCSASLYCPEGNITRSQMAVFLMVSKGGVTPAACPPSAFSDVSPGSPFCPWIKEIARRGITAGCGGGNFCPESLVLRGQMSVFISVTFGIPVHAIGP